MSSVEFSLLSEIRRLCIVAQFYGSRYDLAVLFSATDRLILKSLCQSSLKGSNSSKAGFR